MERKNKRTKPTPSLPNENNRGRTGKVSLLELLEMEDGMCLKYPSMLSKGFYPVERDHGLKSCQILNHSLASYLASDASRRFMIMFSPVTSRSGSASRHAWQGKQKRMVISPK